MRRPVEAKSHAQTEPRLAATWTRCGAGNAGDPESRCVGHAEPSRVGKAASGDGHDISYPTVGTLLRQAGYKSSGDQEAREGKAAPGSQRPFEYIYGEIHRQQSAGQP